MEPPNQNDDEDCFFDALDDLPFHDFSLTDQSGQSTSDSTLSELSPDVSSPANTLRRRSISCEEVSGIESKDTNPDSSSISSNIAQVPVSKPRYNREKRYKLYRDLKENEKNLVDTESARTNRDLVVDSSRVDSVEEISSVANEKKEEGSEVKTAKDDRAVDSADSVGEIGDSCCSNLLVFIAGLVIRAIGFQVNLLINLVKLPMWALYCSCMLVVDPFGAVRRGRGFLMQKMVSVWNLASNTLNSLLNDWLKEHKSIWNLLLRFGWGLFWSFYVCIILCGLSMFSIMISGFLMRWLVEEPMQIQEDLNFDYRKDNPVAFVPIMFCGGAGCGVNCKEKIGDVRSLRPRVKRSNHKLQVTILLTLPESEYNRNLGMFQVRVDFLSDDGKTLASKSHPCMLKFKSTPIRLVLTFLKIAPLLTGYMSESQTLELKIGGFTEGDVPTSCLKVLIEQRAQYQPGAGIPEIYYASLILESELPFLKGIIWCWKKTVFIWISMTSFMMVLLFTLICCRPVIIPRTRLRDGSTINNSTPNNLPE